MLTVVHQGLLLMDPVALSRGNSNTTEQIDLVARDCFQLFARTQIAYLLPTEFVGRVWINTCSQNSLCRFVSTFVQSDYFRQWASKAIMRQIPFGAPEQMRVL